LKNKKQSINYLQLTPTQLRQHEVLETGLLAILVPKFKFKILSSLLPKSKSQFFRFKLDKIGSSTWLKIDGKRKVEHICAELSQEFGAEIEPVNERVTIFLSKLYKDKFINFQEFLDKK